QRDAPDVLRPRAAGPAADDDAGRARRRAVQRVEDRLQFARRNLRRGQYAGHFGPRLEFERHLGDDAEGAEGAGVQFHQVVAGDVLDDAAAGPGLGAVVGDEADADDVVAEGAVAVAARPADVGGDGAAEGGPLRVRHVDRQPLVLGGEDLLQPGDR